MRPAGWGAFGVTHEVGLSLERLAEAAALVPAGATKQHADQLPVAHHSGAVRRLRRPPAEVITAIAGGEFAWVFVSGLDRFADIDGPAADAVRAWEARVVAAEGPVVRADVSAFAAAPGAVVPAHVDVHHNILMQVLGTKEVVIAPAPDGGPLEAEVEECIASGNHNLRALPAGAQTFTLAPGEGVYIPPFAPHWVVGGTGVTLSLSRGWRTRITERERLVRYWNARQRRLGLAPSAPRPGAWGDRAKVAAVRIRGQLVRSSSRRGSG